MGASQSMQGKVCLVTGGSSGIGKATALGLARLGATVIVVARDRKRCEAAIMDIQQHSGNPSVEMLLADLSSQEAVRRLAQAFLARYQVLHILVNNAAVVHPQRVMTADGIEATFAVNYLAPFLLTHCLLETLKASAPARIINVTSALHGGTLRFDRLEGAKDLYGSQAYVQSKLALILFTYELARRVQGTGVTVNCVHPGVVKSDLNRRMTGLTGLFTCFGNRFIGTDPATGAQTLLYLASSPDVEEVNGKYFANMKESKSSKQSYDQALQQQLWRVSERLTHMTQ